jgi:hypothetical protein
MISHDFLVFSFFFISLTLSLSPRDALGTEKRRRKQSEKERAREAEKRGKKLALSRRERSALSDQNPSGFCSCIFQITILRFSLGFPSTWVARPSFDLTVLFFQSKRFLNGSSFNLSEAFLVGDNIALFVDLGLVLWSEAALRVLPRLVIV